MLKLCKEKTSVLLRNCKIKPSVLRLSKNQSENIEFTEN